MIRPVRVPLLLGLLMALGLLAGVPGASAAGKYELISASASLSSTQAGAHPNFTTAFELASEAGKPNGRTRDVIAKLPPGLTGSPQKFPMCTLDQFGASVVGSNCPQDSQIGVETITLAGEVNGTFTEPLYNMPSPGGDIVARFGFYAALYPTLINIRLNPDDYTLEAAVEGAPSSAELISSTTTVWGVPADKSHDALRLTVQEAFAGEVPSGGRASGQPKVPFLSNPTECGVQRQIEITAVSYNDPSQPTAISAPFPQIGGCDTLEFNPTGTLKTTTSQGTSGSGLDYQLDLPTEGLEFPNLNAASHLRHAVVTLPEGMSVNPSQAVGLGVCTEADLARERYDSGPNVGCPESSKLGSVVAESPAIDRKAEGSLFVAKPYENPFGSLIALYMVLKIPDRGVLVRLPGKVELNPKTGQITTTFDDVPQLPVSSFRLHFREGARAPLITPSACGSYAAISNFNPWSAPAKIVSKTSTFRIESGPDHGPCPSGGLPPFHPSLTAGTLNNAAGSYSPFIVELTRGDSEQEITNFSIKLPPGVAGKLAGIPSCPDAAIAVAAARTGPYGGAEEIARPSCPAASQVGNTLAGAGVGQVLAYAPGKVYLAGPYHGAPLSFVAITAGVVGPFDVGTVVVRLAIDVNPETGEVFLDATGSDPIPHILRGVVLHLRDIRAFTDRPEFTFNPTSCEPATTTATMLGSGLDLVSAADNNPFVSASPFQAADCASLKYRPRLQLKLKGSPKRGGNPALTAILRPRAGDANSKRISVALPPSEFLDQSHIRTICTRVQFKEAGGNGEACPAASVYGKVKAYTPLLDEPLRGNVYLRSSEHPLPDLVFSLRGQVDFHAVGRIDSAGGGIRTTFDFVPDAPITKVEVNLGGGKKSLLENSTNLCKGSHKAIADYTAHNGKAYGVKVPLRAQCGKKGKKAKKAKKRRAALRYPRADW